MGVATELVADVHNHVGEGPAWDDRDGSLLWIDIVPGHVFKLTVATGELTQITLGQETSVCIPRASGGYVVGLQDGIFGLDKIADGWSLEPLVDVELDNPGNLMNDCKCDALGRLWGGTRSRDWIPATGGLYRVEPNLTAHQVLNGLNVSNGIGWNPEFTRMYFVDSKPEPGTLDVLDFDLETGTATNRRTFVEIPNEPGYSADGLAVDAEGYVWLALLGASAVYRYAPDGSLDDVVALPTKQPTSCCFGGPDLTDLYVTSGNVDMTDAEHEADPHAGGVFVVNLGVKGQPTIPFAG